MFRAHSICLYALTCWTLTTSSWKVLGQDDQALPPHSRAALLSERDKLASKATATVNRGEWDKALGLLDEVFKIEQSLFGDAHEELLGTLGRQANYANANNQWDREIEFRRRAYEMGKIVHGAGSYQLKDLELALQEATDNSRRTDDRLALLPVPQLLPAMVKQDRSSPLPCELLLVGDVDYDHRASEAGNASPPNEPPRPRKRLWERSAFPSTLRGGRRWERLEETRTEVEFIGGLYRRLFDPNRDAVIDLRQSEATESAFLEYAPQSMFIHLATHGFFSEPRTKSALSRESDSERGDATTLERQHVARGYSPGQLSGIVFAGANRSPEAESRADAPNDDGIMTADEIAYLPLSGTRLVVLSACETGLGEVAAGEGLLGIQRAFHVAGAKSTIATLWRIDDAATRRLMQEFYTNYLDKEMSALDALRQAQLWALNHPDSIPRGSVRPRRKPEQPQPNRLSPKYWAPFVLSGDWR